MEYLHERGMLSVMNMLKQKPRRSFIIVSSCLTSALLTIFVRYNLTWQANLLRKSDFKGFLLLTLVSLLAYILGSFLNCYGTYFLLSKNIQEYLHSIRAQLLQKYDDDVTASQVQNDLINNLETVENRYLILIVALFENSSLLLFSIMAIFSLHWIIVLCTLIFSLILLKLPNIFKKELTEASVASSNQTENYMETIESWIKGLDVLRRFNSYTIYFRKLNVASSAYANFYLKSIKVSKVVSTIVVLSNVCVQIIIFALTGALIIYNIVPFGAIFSIGSLVGYTFSYVVIIANGLIQMKNGKAIVDQLNEQLRKQKVEEKQNLQLKVKKYLINNLHVKFENGVLISYPNVEINSGDKVLLTGPSGAGKSTFLKLFMGELKATDGEIVAVDESGHNHRMVRETIGYISQDPVLLPVSIIDNITMFSAELKDDALEIIKQVKLQKDVDKFKDGINNVVNVTETNLSGGQKQKIVLARTLLYKKPLILIDEGTSAIDSRSAEDILKVVTNIDATVIVIAHNLTNEMKELFDKEIKLKPLAA